MEQQEMFEKAKVTDVHVTNKPTPEEFLAIWEDNHYTASIFADIIWDMAIKSKL